MRKCTSEHTGAVGRLAASSFMGIIMVFNDYVNNIPYPDKPKKPEILKKAVEELTDEQLMNVASIRRDYTAQLERYLRARDDYHENENLLHNQFYSDLKKEHGIMDADLHQRIYDYAWAEGHSEGLERVAAIYEEIVGIIRG